MDRSRSFRSLIPVDDSARRCGRARRERRAFPDPPGHQLERPVEIPFRLRRPDHHRDAPTAVTGLQCLAHHGGMPVSRRL